METKTAKITSVQENQKQFEYQGTKYFDHWIKYEGVDKVCIYSSKSPKCDKFKVGEEATFDLDTKPNGIVKIKPKSDFKKAEPKDSGIITYLSCFSSACNFYAGKLQASDVDVFSMAEKAFEKAFEKSTLKNN